MDKNISSYECVITTTTVVETKCTCPPNAVAQSPEKSFGEKVVERAVLSAVAAVVTGGASIGLI